MAQCIRRTINSGKHDTATVAVYHEYVVIYAKNIEKVLLNRKAKTGDEKKRLYHEVDQYVKERGRYYISQLNKNSIQYSDSLNFPIKGPDGVDIWPGNGFDDKEWCWRWGKEKIKWGIDNDYIVFRKQGNKYKVYAKSYEYRDNSGNPIERTNPYTTLEFVAKEYGNFNATPETAALFDGKKVFDFPKSEVFLRELVRMANLKPDSIVLDFFSGSATTAHAVMQLNSEDGGHRRFIMVQLPEPTSEDSEARKTGYKNICEIGKGRIRRAGKKIKGEIASQAAQGSTIAMTDGAASALDTGFRVFRLDESNYEAVKIPADEYTKERLKDMVVNIKRDRTDLDLFFGCILEWGLPLDMEYGEAQAAGLKVLLYGGGDLIACFEKVTVEAARAISEMRTAEGTSPLHFVMRDDKFTGEKADEEKISVIEVFRQLAPDMRVHVV